MDDHAEGYNSRYNSILSNEQHALLGQLYDKTAENLDDVDNVAVLKSFIVNPCASIPLSGYDHNFEDDRDEDDRAFSQIEETLQIPISDDELSQWPQRLLHVESMRSYHWQPGNKYGEYVAPRYNAISYTWGRYDIDNPLIEKKVNKRVREQTKVIGIQGIEWNIPRIDPEHFTVENFQGVIRQSCKLGAIDKVDFLWIDIACIDQRNGPQKDLEIGRQAMIFRGAQRVFIWLTRLHEVHLQGILSDLVESSIQAVQQFHIDWLQTELVDKHTSWILRSRTALDNLFIDPWFTSLWTLQEAFLCPNAYLLGREATQILDVPASTPGSFVSANLSNLLRCCDGLRRVSETKFMTGLTNWPTPTPPKIDLHRKYLNEVNTMINLRGLSALATANPIALYGIASYRRTSRDVDRIYGIEQVFGLRLGASIGGLSATTKSYNRFVLEAQLGLRILQMFPVLSQLHVFTEPVELGRGWRASPASRIPDLDLKTSIASIEYQRTTTLTIKTVHGMRFGAFSGRICAFETLRLAWSQVSSPSLCEPLSLSVKSLQQICLDVFLSHKKPEYRHVSSDKLGVEGFEVKYPAVWGFSRDVPRGKEQHEMALWMVKRLRELFPGKHVVVLLLGFFWDIAKEEESTKLFNVGLILIEAETHGVSYWRRLGFCIWECKGEGSDIKDATKGLLRAGENDSNWEIVNGVFG